MLSSGLNGSHDSPREHAARNFRRAAPGTGASRRTKCCSSSAPTARSCWRGCACCSSSLLIVLPLINFYAGGGGYESLVGIAGVGLAMLLSQIWLTMARRRRRYRWLPYRIRLLRRHAWSAWCLLLLALRMPAAGLNSVVVWCFYPLVVLATALRNDARVTLVCGPAGRAAVRRRSRPGSWPPPSDRWCRSTTARCTCPAAAARPAAAGVDHGDDADRVPHAAPGPAVGHGWPDRPAESQLPQPPRAAHHRRVARGRATRSAWRCSTWISSSASTTNSATRPATVRCVTSWTPCAWNCGATNRCCAWAARSSCWCCGSRSAPPGNAWTCCAGKLESLPVPARRGRRTARADLQRRHGLLPDRRGGRVRADARRRPAPARGQGGGTQPGHRPRFVVITRPM